MNTYRHKELILLTLELWIRISELYMKWTIRLFFMNKMSTILLRLANLGINPEEQFAKQFGAEASNTAQPQESANTKGRIVAYCTLVIFNSDF